MKATLFFALSAALLLSGSGCSGGKPEAPQEASTPKKATPADQEAKIKENIAKLPKEDQAAAEAQKFCAVAHDNPLGVMGKPYKVTIDGQPIFLCCKHCEKDALQKKEETLATVKKMKEKSKKESDSK